MLWQTHVSLAARPGRSHPVLCHQRLDIALWDILGKLLDVPVYQFLGGAARERMRLYKGAFASTQEALAEQVRKVREQGYTAIRTGLAYQPGRVVNGPGI